MIEPGSANLQVGLVKPLSNTIVPSNNSKLLDDFMSLANFETPLSTSSPVDTIPDSIKSKVWQDIERGIISGEHNEDS